MKWMCLPAKIWGQVDNLYLSSWFSVLCKERYFLVYLELIIMQTHTDFSKLLQVGRKRVCISTKLRVKVDHLLLRQQVFGFKYKMVIILQYGGYVLFTHVIFFILSDSVLLACYLCCPNRDEHSCNLVLNQSTLLNWNNHGSQILKLTDWIFIWNWTKQLKFFGHFGFVCSKMNFKPKKYFFVKFQCASKCRSSNLK